jgi:hypothetical protein
LSRMKFFICEHMFLCGNLKMAPEVARLPLASIAAPSRKCNKNRAG